MLLVHDRQNNFDLIRIAMALLVVWSHAFGLWAKAGDEPVAWLLHYTGSPGDIAVDVFFIISGFLISRSFAHTKDWLRYLGKRVARIYPGFLTCKAICAFVVLPLYAGLHYTTPDVARTVVASLLLRGWFVDGAPFTDHPAAELNVSLWSIPVEFGCYIGVLVIGWSRPSRALLVVLFAIILAAHVWAVAHGKLWWVWPYPWFRMVPFFLTGMIFYGYRDVIPRSSVAAVFGIALFLVLTWTFELAAAAVLPAALGYAVFHIAFGRPIVPISGYGDFSYGVYLYSYPIEQLLRGLGWLSFPAYLAASILCSLVAGVASWFVVERWFLARASGTRSHLSPPVAQPPS